MLIHGEKRFAFLLAAKDSEYVKKLYGGHLNVYVDAFGDVGERWDLFRVFDGEFPDADQLQDYEAFIISGSPHDAYGNEEWILKLCFLLQTLFAMEKKVLGICFGHQVLCRALGGKVGKANSGWDIGIREVRIMKKENLPFKLHDDELEEIPSTLSIIECHQDEVWEVPAGAEVIASSDKTGVEMFTYGENVLGIQGHPEYNKAILNDLIDGLLSNKSIEQVFGENAKKKLLETEPDRKYWKKICKSFLKGKQPELIQTFSLTK